MVGIPNIKIGTKIFVLMEKVHTEIIFPMKDGRGAWI
jgi:hypothetical protein